MEDHTSRPKFSNPKYTADGSRRAKVALTNPRVLWFNTGTLCNIACVNCYIDSSPTNDALQYLTAVQVADYLQQVEDRGWPVTEIGFTGGEPFMNPEFCDMLELALSGGYAALVLTNAMRPMMRPSIKKRLAALADRFPDMLTLRVSLDHWQRELHDQVRGKGSFASALKGMQWLASAGISMTVAGRSIWNEPEATTRQGFARFFQEHDFPIDAFDPLQTVIFPEMDLAVDVPEISTACWGILNKTPDTVMCSSSRMVVHRKGSNSASVVACTLIPYDPRFELGPTLADAEKDVALNHPHCAKFCVLGGASCSG